MVVTSTRAVNLRFRLTAPEAGTSAAVSLRETGERWIAVADFEPGTAIGLGATARQALAAALAGAGERQAAALMADPELFAVSQAILRSA